VVKFRRRIDELTRDINKSESHNKLVLQNVNEELNKLKSRYDKVVEEKHQLELNSVKDDANADLERINQELNESIIEKQNRLNELEEISRQYNELALQIKDLGEAAQSLTAEKNELTRVKLELEDTINKLKERQRVIYEVKENDNKGLVFELTGDEKRLIELLHEIGNMYRELREDLATIEWKKIWLPKVQDWNAAVKLDKRGIYKIEVIGSDGICYIGQAVNIKERWYQHIKKMIGAMPKGNEKLYKFRPEDMKWSIVEFGENIDLNECERYWIEYFGCKEIGLNRI